MAKVGWSGLLAVVLGLTGCGVTEVRQRADLRALAERLDAIETVRLAEQSKSEPVTIEQATKELAAQAADPNEMKPATELTLEEVRVAALKNNLGLKAELIDPAVAQQGVEEAQAAFEWILFGSGRYLHSESDDGDTSSSRFYETGVTAPLQTGGSVVVSTPISETSGGVSEADVSVRYIQSLLRDAGARINTHPIRIAMYSKGAVDATTKLGAINILAGADIAYWRLYSARKELDVSREQHKLAQNQLHNAHAKVEAGSAPRNEIVRAEAGLAVRLEYMINAETNVRDRERDLKRIMNRPDMPLISQVGILAVTDPDPRGLDLDAEQLAAAALANRMELAAIEFRLAQDEIGVELARNALLPRLDLDYTYLAGGQSHTVGRAFEDTFGDPAQDHHVGLSAAIPLGNRAAKARLRRVRLQRVQRKVDRDQWRQRIRQEVYEALDGMQQTWRRILAAEQGLVRAYRAYEVEQSQFQLGRRNSTDVLIAADRLADAQLRRISAFVDYEIAQVLLARSTGVLLGQGQVPLQPATLEGK